MTLRRQIVDFVWLNLLNDANEIGGIRQIAVVQFEAHVLFVRVLVEMIDAVGIERRRASFDAVDARTLCDRNSARYAPSWPVIPVINAVFPNVSPRLKALQAALFVSRIIPSHCYNSHEFKASASQPHRQ